MASIHEHIFDTTLLAETLAYLGNQHQLVACVTDHQGMPVEPPPSGLLPLQRHYPFTFLEPIGGLLVSAASQEILDRAEPHVRFCLAALNNQLQREAELRETGDEMLQLSSQLHFLFQLAEKIAGVDDLHQCYRITLTEIASAIKADRALLVTSGRWDESIRIACRIPAKEIDRLLKKSCFAAAPKDRTNIYTCDDGSSALLSPIREKEGLNGFTLYLKDKDQRFFTAYEKKFVRITEQIISPAFETLRLYDNLQELYLNTVKALAAAIDAKDRYTHGHSFRVAKYALAIGRHLDIDRQQLNDLEIAAYMHDLGKIGISESILGKPGSLTNREFAEIKKHPEFTNKILEPIKLPSFIIDAAVQHHERLDGSGYPLGIAGGKSPFSPESSPSPTSSTRSPPSAPTGRPCPWRRP